jgi:two-component system chemotaxis response regulator CheB
MPSLSTGYLSGLLAQTSKLPVHNAFDGQPLEQGHVYVAPPNRHLLLMGGTIRLGDGPRENMARPSVDALFHSAALSYGPRVIGVVLSGLLNDGAAGLGSIKSCGGTAIVQHPLDAEAGQMPLAALEAVEVDHIAAAQDLGGLLARIVQSEVTAKHDPSPQLGLEVEIAAGRRLGSARLREIADPSALSCPDCQGVLSELRGSRPLRYRCQIGHAYTADVLMRHSEKVQEALSVALRVIEERVTLVERMAADARRTGRMVVAELHEARSEEYRRYATTLKEAAMALHQPHEPETAQKA